MSAERPDKRLEFKDEADFIREFNYLEYFIKKARCVVEIGYDTPLSRGLLEQLREQNQASYGDADEDEGEAISPDASPGESLPYFEDGLALTNVTNYRR